MHSVFLAAITVADHKVASQSQSVWQVLGPVSILFGVIWPLTALVNWLRKRPERRYQERLTKAALEEEVAEASAHSYKAEVNRLLGQLADVQREARLVFLRDRVDSLEQTIGSELAEYNERIGELEHLGVERTSTLDDDLRLLIEQRIQPHYVRRRRDERIVLLLLAVLVALSVSPFSLGQFLANGIDIVFDPADYAQSDLVTTAVFGILLFAGVTELVRRLVARRTAIRRPSARKLVVLMVSSGFLALAAALLVFVGVINQPNAQYDIPGTLDVTTAALCGGIPLAGLFVAGFCHFATTVLRNHGRREQT